MCRRAVPLVRAQSPDPARAMNELAIIDRIRKLQGTQRGLVLGIGDDCAIFRPRAGEDLLFTTDQMIQDVHFFPSHPARAVGERALARSLSDIAAMGGTPRFCLVTLAVPPGHEKWIDGFYRGLLRLAKRTHTSLAGGDLSHSDRIHCDVMVCGSVRRGKALRRDGARPGDLIYVSGKLGKPWTQRIEPRLALGRKLVGLATSCIDLSDGLSLDLHRLCVASGVAADLDQVPVVRGATLDRALNGGEDYELLFTGKKAPPGAYAIGRIVTGTPGAIRFQGRALQPAGYDHFK
jgi:thiamine-monophosphate kinase